MPNHTRPYRTLPNPVGPLTDPNGPCRTLSNYIIGPYRTLSRTREYCRSLREPTKILPGHDGPSRSLLETTGPYQTLAKPIHDPTWLCRTLSDPAGPYRILAKHTWPYRTVPEPAGTCRSLPPSLLLPHPTAPYRTIPDPTAPRRIVPSAPTVRSSRVAVRVSSESVSALLLPASRARLRLILSAGGMPPRAAPRH